MPVSAQERQVAWQASAQQLQSTQWPLLQASAFVHACPRASLQPPLPSQELVPLQGLVATASGCSRGVKLHTPLAVDRAQERQSPEQAVSQQTPSAQSAL